MGLRDMLKKKDGLGQDGHYDDDDGDDNREPAHRHGGGPQLTVIRTDAGSQQQQQPMTGADSFDGFLSPSSPGGSGSRDHSKSRRSLDIFRSAPSRSASASSSSKKEAAGKESAGKRLSHRLHQLGRHQPQTSEHVPDNLPEIVVVAGGGGGGPGDDPQDRDAAELEWERRATILAEQNGRARSRPPSPGPADRMAQLSLDGSRSRSQSQSATSGQVSSKAIDADIQEAIRLHEEGDFIQATKMFGRLADERGANNPLSQVLYGLALRHGWGCTPDPERAVHYLTAAASNAAAVEQLALQAGLKKGGAAKGELVLAIFELANCFRHGWGIAKDPIAAKQYYETAANLGDADAMNEVAWCYLEGYGCKKDKYAAARYYRQAEKAGNKTLGNSWIWKEKYDPPGDGSGGKKKKK